MNQKNSLILPISIIIAGVLIGGGLFLGLFLTRKTDSPVQKPKNEHLEKNLVAVSAADHILGSPTAPVMIVEHSDTDCPYCQAFLPALHSVIDQFGSSGKVSWVYRHFAIHPNVPKEAEASECVAAIGGNAKFWQYIDLLFSKKNFNEQPYKGVDPGQLPVLAASIGVSKTAVAKCLSDGTYKAKVDKERADSIQAGGTGTPYTVIVSKAAISKETRKMVEDKNKTIVAGNPAYPDLLYLSPDNHLVVINGAMPTDFMTALVQSLIQSNP